MADLDHARITVTVDRHGRPIDLGGFHPADPWAERAGCRVAEYVRADVHAEVARERDEAVVERDVMRKANVTPDDADRPYGQSVEYWQDKALDYASGWDKRTAELAALKRVHEQAQRVIDQLIEAGADMAGTLDALLEADVRGRWVRQVAAAREFLEARDAA